MGAPLLKFQFLHKMFVHERWPQAYKFLVDYVLFVIHIELVQLTEPSDTCYFSNISRTKMGKKKLTVTKKKDEAEKKMESKEKGNRPFYLLPSHKS